ncbi:hypothetical protein K438DRAFT_1753356 [Mycena galopus ATCC 62051]|nr:hypothetical protein K438DRAFT_1753356 [Mycena galopus ATCC 62051]
MFTTVYDIRQAHGPKWSDRLREYNIYAAALVQGFELFRVQTGKLEAARDRVRSKLDQSWPREFPTGATVTAIDDLATRIFRSFDWGVGTVKCTKCDHIEGLVAGFCRAQTIVYDKQLHSRFKENFVQSQQGVLNLWKWPDPAVTFNAGETKVRYVLRAVIYSGNLHFTSRIIKPNGSVWYHDDIETGNQTEAQGFWTHLSQENPKWLDSSP